MKPIVIYGAGGFASEVLELIRDINRDHQQWEVLGFLSDDPDTWGEEREAITVLGGERWLERQRGVSLVLGVGSPAVKARLAERLRPQPIEWPALIHPSVVRSNRVRLSFGTVIAAGSILTTNIIVQDFAMVNLACTIGHDCSLGAFSTLAPGVHVSGNVRIEEGVDIGTGTVLIPGVTVGAWSIVGAGTVVTQSLPNDCTAVGVPARVVKQRTPGWQHQE